MKKPDEEKLSQMYGKNEDKKKAYRKGWDTVGDAIQIQKNSKKEKVKYRHK
jgi:N6-adenosine-specific RNA methylase IME4